MCSFAEMCAPGVAPPFRPYGYGVMPPILALQFDLHMCHTSRSAVGGAIHFPTVREVKLETRHDTENMGAPPNVP